MKINILGPGPARHKLKPIGKRLSELLKKANPQKSSLNIMVAYAHETFLGYIGDSLEKFVGAGGDVEMIIGVDSRGTSKIALSWLLDLLGFRRLFVYHNPGNGTFHPKIAIFKGARVAHLFVGSSNLTGGGLSRNFEFNVEIELNTQKKLEKSYLTTFEKIFRKTKNCPSCLPLNNKTLKRIDKAGALKHRSPKKAETVITKKSGIALSTVFGKTKHHHPKPTVRRRKKRLKTISFIMSLVHNDVSGKRGDPYFLVPILARDQNPKFWRWPTRFHPTRAKGVPERRFATKVKIAGKQLTEQGRLSYYGGVDEFRFKSKSIYGLGTSYSGSFIVISWAKDRWGRDAAHLQLAAKGTPKHNKLSKLSFQKVGRLKKRFAYI